MGIVFQSQAICLDCAMRSFSGCCAEVAVGLIALLVSTGERVEEGVFNKEADDDDEPDEDTEEGGVERIS